MIKRILVLAALSAASLGVAPAPARALPHGCISASSDHWVQADAYRRSFGLGLYRDQPCSFVYMPGDTYSGLGRFSVSCESGGYYFHPDYDENGEGHIDQHVPIPQPCRRGDVVTVNGFHTGTGGSVTAGGLNGTPSPSLRTDKGDFGLLCDNAASAHAAVSLDEPVNYNGQLTFGGTVDCRGATVRITSLTITGLAGHPDPVDAGSAECRACRQAIAVTGTVPARWTEWDVEMAFTVSRGGRRVSGTRVGRYVTTWAGHVTTIYPEPSDGCTSDPTGC